MPIIVRPNAPRLVQVSVPDSVKQLIQAQTDVVVRPAVSDIELRPVVTNQILRPQPTKVINSITKGPKGDKGEPGGSVPAIDFSFGDAPTVVFTAPAAGNVVYARVIVETVFNGTDPQFQLGTVATPDLIVQADQVNLGAGYEYEVTMDEHVAAGTQLLITLTPGAGATQGTGVLILQFLPD